MMRDLESVLHEVVLCKNSANNEKLSSLFAELDLAVLEYDEWPVSFFQGILELLRDQDFRRLDNSWLALYFLNSNWEQLTHQQRKELRPVLKEGFDKHHNWMGAFVTSELLGERYTDEDALVALVDLGKSATLPAKAAVPHGLEVLAKTMSNESLRGHAIEHLRELQGSDSEQVRQEALISLKKLRS